MAFLSDSEILKNIQSQNFWWITGAVDKELVPAFKRSVFSKVHDVFFNEIRRFPVLSGPRRAGKSTIMFQTIDELLTSGVKPERILFYTLDEFPSVKSLKRIKNISMETMTSTCSLMRLKRINPGRTISKSCST